MESIDLIQKNDYVMKQIPKDGEVVNAIKRKSADSLPNSPAACGMKAGMVKPKFWQPLVQGEFSLLGIINELIKHLNDNFEDVKGKQEGSVTGVVFDKETRNLTVSFGFEKGEENDIESTVISLGNGVKDITLSSSDVLEDTYAITYLSGTTQTLTVKHGKDAIAPQIRINTDNNEWEVSTDGGKTWTSTGVHATGDQLVTFYADYGTIEEMEAAVETQADDGVPPNGLVMIQYDATVIEDGDATGRVYRKTLNADGTYFYKYMADLSGLQGPMGPKPVKGTDYWTEADKAEIKKYVDDAILGGAW